MAVLVDDGHRGPLINIITWIALVAMGLATLIKFGTKLARLQRLQLDDYFFLAAMLLATGQGISATFQVSAGLGQHQANLTGDQIIGLQKALYAAQILYIPALCLSRLAVLQFLTVLTRDDSRRKAVRNVMIANLLWLVAAAIAIAFQCPLPQGWAIFSGKCFKQVIFWDASAAIELLLDLVESALPIYLLYDVQMQGKSKSSAVMAFSLRLLSCPFIIARVISINQTSASKDHSYDDFNTVLLTVLHINFAIIISCAPFLKQVMQSLQVGWLTNDLRSHRGSSTPGGSKFQVSSRNRNANLPTGGSDSLGWTELRDNVKQDTVIMSGPAVDAGDEDGMVIKQTTMISVQYQE